MNFASFEHHFSISKPNTKLIYINIAVFLVVAFINVFRELMGMSSFGFAAKLQLPSDYSLFVKQFWSIFTYMFLHLNLLHVFFNMLCLYWFGQIFLMYFTDKQFVGVYILGGLFGGIAYLLSYSYIPYFEGKVALLCGASASIIALITASALEMPNMPIRLLLIGTIKLKWVAVATVLISVLGITSDNAGGEIAHIGGAVGGWIWFVLLKRNIEITKPIDFIISFFTKVFNMFSGKKPKLKVNRRTKYHYVKPDEAYNTEQKQNNQNLDIILDKIRKSGYGSLTEQEKKQLFDLSNKV